jgi:surface protein
MGLMFVNTTLFNNGSATNDQLNPLNWDVRKVTGFAAMFANAPKFNQNIGQWNTSSATYMAQMFQGATLFDQFICGWNVNNVFNFGDMFLSATAMTTKYSSYTGYGDTPTAQFFNASLAFTYTLPAAYTLTIPFTTSDTAIDASFNWGDGNTQRITTAPFSHTYTNAGTYEIVCNINSGGNNITKIGSGFQVTGNQYLAAIYSAYATTNWGTGNALSEISFYNNAATSNLVSVPLALSTSVTSLDKMFYGAKIFNQNISTWNVSTITAMTGMFQGAIIFNKNLSAWSSLNVNLSSMFRDATAFNNGGVSLTWGIQPTNTSSMFYDAPAFNVEISTWNTSSVTTMANMFRATNPSTTIFNRNIRNWSVSNTATLTNMFNNASAFQSAYYPTSPGYNGIDGSTIDTPLYTFFNEGRYPCFMEGTQILCFKNNKEVYRPIQELRKGDLVKTISNGYLPIYMIGTSELKNPGHDKRVPNRLYKYTSEKYPELFEDLYITGCHSVLVPFLTDDEWDNTKAMLGDIFVTDNHFRLMACLDENSEPYCKAAYINIYHIALENTNYYMNYGVYANGLLVESCSKRYLTELSNMRILGEEDCRLKDNVLAMNSKYNTNIEVM